MSTRYYRHTRYGIFSLLVGLLGCLIFGPEAWSQGPRLPDENTRQQRARQGLSVAVHDGQLSVDVLEADLAEVLAHIGQQAGLRISAGPSAGKRVSAQFSGVELDEGLRRLLRSASLSHICLYARKPAGSVTISEVRVLGEGKDVSPPPAMLAGPGDPAYERKTTVPVGKGRMQAPEVVQPVQEPMPEPRLGESTEVTGRIREASQLSKEVGNRPRNRQESSPDEAR